MMKNNIYYIVYNRVRKKYPDLPSSIHHKYTRMVLNSKSKV
jgi:hypothetical protein